MAYFRSSMPWPVALEISKNGRPRSRASSRSASTRSRILRDVHLGGHHDHRLGGQFLAETRQLAHDDLEIVHRVAAAGFGDVHQMRQQARALDVAQELDAQAVALVRAFDQPRNVGHHEAAEVVGICTTPRFGSSVVNG